MLTAKQSEQLRKELKAAEQRLLQNAQNSLQLSIERQQDTEGDSIDQSNREEQLSTTFRLRDREQKLLNKIREAMHRLEEGIVDECEQCGEPIGFKRLLARPVTTLCIDCKQAAEEEEDRLGHADHGAGEGWGQVSASADEEA